MEYQSINILNFQQYLVHNVECDDDVEINMKSFICD